MSPGAAARAAVDADAPNPDPWGGRYESVEAVLRTRAVPGLAEAVRDRVEHAACCDAVMGVGGFVLEVVGGGVRVLKAGWRARDESANRGVVASAVAGIRREGVRHADR